MQCRRINLALAVFGTTLVSTIGIGTSPATAAPLVISVTTPADGIYDDGLTTLREAVEIANAASGPSEIRLLPGAKHNLSGCSAARGDLDITTDHDVTIVGGGATIVQLCEDRHIDHQPPGGTARLLITGTTLTGAHGVTSEGGSIRTTGALALDQTTIADTSDGIAAVVALGDAPITLDLTTITGTRRGAGLASFGEASVRVTDSTITHNLTGYRGDGAPHAPAAGVSATGNLLVEFSTIASNRSLGPALPTWPFADGTAVRDAPTFTEVGGALSLLGTLTVTDSMIRSNGGQQAGGIKAQVVHVLRSTITGNVSGTPDGAAGAVHAGDVTITESVLTRNSGGHGTGAVAANHATIGRSLVAQNHSSDAATLTATTETAPGGYLDDAPTWRIERSTVTDNRSRRATDLAVHGAAIDLDHATLTAGSTPADDVPVAPPVSLALEGASAPNPALLTMRGSTVATAGIASCTLDAGAFVFSNGYNADADDSCGLDQNVDLPGIGDPQLEPLPDIVNPMSARVPMPTSPLRDVVPPGAAGCIPAGLSQNDLVLPQGPACEVGAAERPTSSGLAGTVTDVADGSAVAGITVRIRDEANAYVAATTTDAAGRWDVQGLAPGTYKVVFIDPGGTFTLTFNGGFAGFGRAPGVVLDGATLATVDQALFRPTAITGTVTDGLGAPLGGVEVRVRTLDNAFLTATKTAPDGTYAVAHGPGTYKLRFSDPTGTHLAEWHQDQPTFTDATPVTVAEGETVVDAALTAAG